LSKKYLLNRSKWSYQIFKTCFKRFNLF
jgi:hypothetical protein